jgi:hypothetical protein
MAEPKDMRGAKPPSLAEANHALHERCRKWRETIGVIPPSWAFWEGVRAISWTTSAGIWRVQFDDSPSRDLTVTGAPGSWRMVDPKAGDVIKFLDAIGALE